MPATIMKTSLVPILAAASSTLPTGIVVAFVSPRPSRTPPPPPRLAALHAGLRDLVGEYSDYDDGDDLNRPPYSPVVPSVRDSSNGGGGPPFDFNPFVDDRSYDRNYVTRQPPFRGGVGGGGPYSYDARNVGMDYSSSERDRYERDPRFYDTNGAGGVNNNYYARRGGGGGGSINNNAASAVRARRQGQPLPGVVNSPNNGRRILNGSNNYGGNQRRVNDIPIPTGRSAGQLARMYTNLEEGNSNFNSLTVVERYFEAWNRRNVPLALTCFDENVYYDDTQFSKAFEGKDDLAKHLIYVADCVPESFRFVIDGLSVGPAVRRRNSMMELNRNRGRRNGGPPPQQPSSSSGFNPVARALNGDRRLPASSSSYERSPSSLTNLVNIAALWHVENENGPLPFARGCSFYMVNPNTNLIVEGYDFPEPAVIKPGSTGLKILSIASKLVDEPIRLVPFVVWVTYIWVVFFSNGILPGKDAFQFEARSWEEVRALSLNFFYVSPILGLKLSPSVHPCLEAVFNTLLAWAFLFMGFLSDERTGAGSESRSYERYYEKLSQRQEEILEDGRILVPPVSLTKRNLISILPTVIGMQFLTSAFLLPYLFCRTSERSAVSSTAEMRRPRSILTRPLYKEELDKSASVVGEWRGLGIIMGAIGLLGVYWFFNGRVAEFGPPLWESPKRMQSFMKLLSIDRVGSSFIVDLVIFAVFQGWLVDDDWKRRGRSMEDEKFLRNVAKFVPFWGLACYLTFRPKFPSRDELDIDEIDSRGFLNTRNNNGFFGDFGRNFRGDFRGDFNGYNPRGDDFNRRR